MGTGDILLGRGEKQYPLACFMLRKLEVTSGRVGLSCAPLPYLYLCIVARAKGKSFSRENKSLVYVNLHSTVAQKCHENFNFVHGNFNFTHSNFNLFTAFQFTHGNFNLLTAISTCSREFQFTHGNFNFLTATLTAFFASLTTCPTCQLWWPTVATKSQTQNQKSIFKVDLQSEK